MHSHRWRSIQSGLPESAHGSPELVKHAQLIEVDGMSCNEDYELGTIMRTSEDGHRAAATAGPSAAVHA